MSRFEDVLVLKDKVTETLNKINKKAKEQGATLDKLKGKLAKVQAGYSKLASVGAKAFKTLSMVGAGVAVAGGAIVATANKVADMGDRIDKTSQKIGMSRKSFQEWDYIMSQNGGSVETLQMGFKTLATQMENVQKGNKDSTKAFQQLGVSVKDNNGKFRTQEDVFNDTIRALQKIKNPTEKAMLANKLFGRSALELKPLLNQEADAVDELRQKANSMGMILSDEEIDNAVKYKDTMDTFTRVFEAKMGTVVVKIMPALIQGLEIATNLISKSIDFFDNLGGAIGTVIGQIISIPTYIEMGFNTLKTNLIITFTNIKNKIMEVINIILKIPQMLGNIGGAIGQFGVNAGKSILNKVNNNKTTNNTTNNTNNTTNNNFYGNINGGGSKLTNLLGLGNRVPA